MVAPAENSLDPRADTWAKFFRQQPAYMGQFAEISRQYPFLRCLVVDIRDVQKWGKAGLDFADDIITNPEGVIADIRSAIRNHNLVSSAGRKSPVNIETLNIYFQGHVKTTPMRELRYENVLTYVALKGVVTRVTEVRPKLEEAVFRCPRGHFTKRKQTGGVMAVPVECGTDGCGKRILDLVPQRSTFVNQQMIRIRENVETLKPGQQPQTLDVVVRDDLCDRLMVNDHATLYGILQSSQRVAKGTKTNVFDFHLDLMSAVTDVRGFEEVSISDEEVKQIESLACTNALEKIVRSIAPSVFGNAEIKEAIALQLFGGITKENSDSTQTRGWINILLVGDPGTGKTGLIRAAVALAPRGRFATLAGSSSSAAGLIGTVRQDDFTDAWVLEPGSLVFADESIHGVDEINKAEGEIRSAFYEQMEDGKITITKAAARAMRARTAILGGANPKHERFDYYAGDLEDQIGMAPAFLSRFDLIFMVEDRPEQSRDQAIAQHIANKHRLGELRMAGKIGDALESDLKQVEPEVPADLLKKWIAHAKRTITPVLTHDAMDVITSYYVQTRGMAGPNKPVPVTARADEAVIRIAEALARLRLSESITKGDAEKAVRIFHECFKRVATDPKTGNLDAGMVGDGQPKTKTDIMGAVKHIISKDKDDHPRGTPRQYLMDRLSEEGFKDADRAVLVIEKMLRSGELMEPRDGYLRLT
jgi:replicative DNA helicase Mcm